MLEKKGISPVQCQTATNSGNSCGGGTTGGATAGITSQASVADNSNGLEPNVLSQNRNSGSNGTNLSNLTSASINSTNSGPNTPSEKMGAMSATQDFVVIKSEEQKSVQTNHCDSKTNETNAIPNQIRNNNSIDSKPNICGNNRPNNAINNAINSNNNLKSRDNNNTNIPSQCPPNGPLNGIRANSTSPMNILSDDKLSAYPELAMPVPTGNLSMPGDVPPLPMMPSMPQSMNMMRIRGPSAQGPQVANHMIGAHPHNNSQNLMTSNITSQKSSATMDSQYMQQQSQIFVFTTKLANRAAEAVDSQQFSSIIDYHCSNPETKRLLEKYPLKPQMNRTNSSAVWLNSLAQRQGTRGMKAMHPSALKNFGQPRGPIPGSCVTSCGNNMHNSSGLPSGPGPGGGGPGVHNNWPNNGNMCSNPNASPNWSSPQQPMFAQNFEMNSNQKQFMNSGMTLNGPMNRPPFASNNVQNNPQMFNNCNPGTGVPPHLAGCETPDENLTPQQKQHREKQLAILRKMQQQLCPEMMDSSPMGQMIRMPAPNQSLNAPDFIDQNMCPNNMCSIPESDHLGGGDANMNNCMTPSSMMSTQNNSSQYSQSQSSLPSTSTNDWQKHNYSDDRRRKSQNCGQGGGLNNMCNSNSGPHSVSHPSPLSQPSSALNSPSPCISQSPGSRIPPPPYNQGIRPHSSPHPASPATGSLPLPSPRMQSPADASRQQFNSSGQTRLPHTSPSPATPSADSNSSIPGTGVHSPKSLPASSSQTSIPSSTSSTVVQNNSRTQTSTNVTNMRATTPSTTAPLSSSPSNVKKLPNIMSSKCMNQDCPQDLLLNSLSNPGVDQKPHPNDMSLLGPTLPNSCSSPFNCKEPALMPVPSPQQIQYALGAFEGHELTIQKQPNTSLRDTDLISPAPDLDLGFNSEFGSNCQPFGSNERLHNFPMDNMNPRFPSNPQNANMSGHQFDPNHRFMNADNNNQRFGGPVFDGPNPRIPNHENQFRAQNMLCMPYGQMDSNVMRFNSPCDNPMGPRLRHNHPNDMVSRFPTHPNDIQPSHQFNSSTMSPMSGEQMNLMPFPSNAGTGCMSNMNNFNQQMESGVSSTHLQNLQKMTPPFDIGPPNKVDQMMIPNGPLPHNHNPNNQLISGPGGSMTPQTQRNNFDPISSMAAMSEQNNSQNMMSGPSMNMSSMQVAANGPPPGGPNMVNFHTSMSSMQGIHQNMTPDGNGMQSPYGMSPQMNPQMSGGPQTVNNTYVNATMSIQQLNIQNMSSPNFNPNLEQNMNIGPQPMSGPGMSPPAGAMQMMPPNNSAKMGPNFGHRMTGPNSGPNFSGPQMNNNRGMNPMNFGPNQHMMQRCYNSANIQIKPDTPNTIQYLPPRQQNPNLSARTPSLDFLQRFEPPLTNLGNKLPTHNLQYFPSNNTNTSQTMPLGSRMMGQNMAMAAGPGRPMNPSMVRGVNPNAGMGQQSMIPSGDMFGRPTGPNSMSGPPNAMFANMKQSNAGPMSPVGATPDAAQPLPPSLSHSYNYKQSPFNAVPVPSDPNYAIQFQHFQQQLYATPTNRSSNTSANNNNGNNPRMPANNFYNSTK